MSYKVCKKQGATTAFIVNTDTNAQIAINKSPMAILKYLKEEKYMCTDDKDNPLDVNDEWNISVTATTANKMAKEALVIRKPIRAKVENKEAQKEIIKEQNKKIDAMDVILGLANYN